MAWRAVFIFNCAQPRCIASDKSNNGCTCELELYMSIRPTLELYLSCDALCMGPLLGLGDARTFTKWTVAHPRGMPLFAEACQIVMTQSGMFLILPVPTYIPRASEGTWRSMQDRGSLLRLFDLRMTAAYSPVDEQEAAMKPARLLSVHSYLCTTVAHNNDSRRRGQALCGGHHLPY